MERCFRAAVVAGLAVILSGAVAYAADVPGSKVTVDRTHRASKLIGMNVRNAAGEHVGSIEDLVIDIETGKIAYVAMSFGGILGIGDKLFAVPFSEMKLDHKDNDTFFVLNVSKERLKDAPGFDKSHWPDFADPKWSEHVDMYYRRAQTPVERR